MAAYAELALYADSEHNGGRLRGAAARGGLSVTDLPKDPERVVLQPREDLAWRVPLGLAAALMVRGLPLRLSAPGGSWFASLPVEVLGRRVAAVTVAELADGQVPFPVEMVKLAAAKLSTFAATRTIDSDQAADVLNRAHLPPGSGLLVADRWLDCDSEYRVFCIGAQAVACSPYLVEGEAWGPLLHTHRASFHEDAACFAAEVLTGLPVDRVPPACVLDIARQPGGRLVVLEANTTWGAGLYGCDPEQALRAVLAANEPASAEWAWTPDPVLVQRVTRPRDNC